MSRSDHWAFWSMIISGAIKSCFKTSAFVPSSRSQSWRRRPSTWARPARVWVRAARAYALLAQVWVRAAWVWADPRRASISEIAPPALSWTNFERISHFSRSCSLTLSLRFEFSRFWFALRLNVYNRIHSSRKQIPALYQINAYSQLRVIIQPESANIRCILSPTLIHLIRLKRLMQRPTTLLYKAISYSWLNNSQFSSNSVSNILENYDLWILNMKYLC